MTKTITRDDVQLIPVEKLIPYHNNPKNHPQDQIDKLKSSIKNFGFTVPLIIDHEYEIIAGHARFKAARDMGMKEVPCIVRSDLTEQQVRAFRIADNKLAESSWDEEALADELDILELEGFDIDLTGLEDFEVAELQFDPDEFEPVDETEQPNLDQPKEDEMVVCPNCGEEFPAT